MSLDKNNGKKNKANPIKWLINLFESLIWIVYETDLSDLKFFKIKFIYYFSIPLIYESFYDFSYFLFDLSTIYIICIDIKIFFVELFMYIFQMKNFCSNSLKINISWNILSIFKNNFPDLKSHRNILYFYNCIKI